MVDLQDNLISLTTKNAKCLVTFNGVRISPRHRDLFTTEKSAMQWIKSILRKRYLYSKYKSDSDTNAALYRITDENIKLFYGFHRYNELIKEADKFLHDCITSGQLIFEMV